MSNSIVNIKKYKIKRQLYKTSTNSYKDKENSQLIDWVRYKYYNREIKWLGKCKINQFL